MGMSCFSACGYLGDNKNWLRPRPAGAPEASLSAKSFLRLRPASANQPFGRRWPGYIGLGFDRGGYSARHESAHTNQQLPTPPCRMM